MKTLKELIDKYEYDTFDFERFEYKDRLLFGWKSEDGKTTITIVISVESLLEAGHIAIPKSICPANYRAAITFGIIGVKKYDIEVKTFERIEANAK